VKLGTAIIDGVPRAVRIDGDTAVSLPYADVGAVLSAGALDSIAAATGESLPVDGLQLGALIPEPEKVICAGLTYKSHILETGRKLEDWSTYPMLFAKFWRSLVGPTDDVVIPDNSNRVDWEAELAVVVGTEIFHGDEDEALAAIGGYTGINDVSMRDWQIRTPEMLQGKTFEKSTPLGPYLVTPDEVDHGADLTVSCLVDDVVMQEASTSDMLYTGAQLVSYVSQFVTLVPGDVIATGTPGGIGATRKPPIYLEHGKVMRTVVEGIGECVNHCVAAGSAR
jgi:acylpyruvate hydrolase